MKICIAKCAYITSVCAITELQKTKEIDSIKDEANEIIKRKRARNRVMLYIYWTFRPLLLPSSAKIKNANITASC